MLHVSDGNSASWPPIHGALKRSISEHGLRHGVRYCFSTPSWILAHRLIDVELELDVIARQQNLEIKEMRLFLTHAS